MGKIFISYRREDSIETVGRIYDWLNDRLPPNSLFMDVMSIGPGKDFRKAIESSISSASVVLVVIGPHWVTAKNDKGKRRLDDPDDFVRLEVEAAIQQGIPIIPVLVQNATTPPSRALPTSLAPLGNRNAVKVRPNPDFPTDITQLIEGINELTNDITFSAPRHSGATSARGRQPGSAAGAAPIPDGAKVAPGFHHTKVITARETSGNKNPWLEVVKEYAFESSPTISRTLRLIVNVHKDEVAAWFNFVAEYAKYQLFATVDSHELVEYHGALRVAKWDGRPQAFKSEEHDNTSLVEGHAYRVMFRLKGNVGPGLFRGRGPTNIGVDSLKVFVDDYLLFDLREM